MYPLFNDEKKKEFLKAELGRDVYDFPDEVEQAYANTYSWVLEKADGIDEFIN